MRSERVELLINLAESTHPLGKRLCQLRSDLRIGHSGMCSNMV